MSIRRKNFTTVVGIVAVLFAIFTFANTLYAQAKLVTGTTNTWVENGAVWSGNPSCYDTGFLLSPDSPAIDTGALIPGFHCPAPGSAANQPRQADGSYCVEWYGKAPDIGACEYYVPIAGIVTINTNAIVTLSRRSNDTSSILAILVNANTVIGPGGFEITYPANMTLTVSRRAGNTSSVMAALVNKSNVVIINGAQQ